MRARVALLFAVARLRLLLRIECHKLKRLHRQVHFTLNPKVHEVTVQTHTLDRKLSKLKQTLAPFEEVR